MFIEGGLVRTRMLRSSRAPLGYREFYTNRGFTFRRELSMGYTVCLKMSALSSDGALIVTHSLLQKSWIAAHGLQSYLAAPVELPGLILDELLFLATIAAIVFLQLDDLQQLSRR